jgi:hypothetical protein
VVKMSIVVFWALTLYSLLGAFQNLRGMYPLVEGTLVGGYQCVGDVSPPCSLQRSTRRPHLTFCSHI